MSWGEDLRAARQDVGLSREALARAAGVSAATVKSYEDGSRNPSRQMLVALLEALKVERHSRNNILVAAGFAPDGQFLGADRFPGYRFSCAEAIQHLSTTPWPSFLVNDVMEVLGCNEICELLWGIDLEREFPKPIDRNMLIMASNPRFADRIENWDDMVRITIGTLKGHHRGPEDIERAGPYFAQVMQRFSKGEPRYVARFLELWQEAPARDPKIRWQYSVVWREPDMCTLTFLGVANTANDPEGLAFQDWIPCDAETWAYLEKLRERGR